MRLRFEDLKKIRRGEAVPFEANAIARDAILKLPDTSAIKLFNDAELNKWHGTLLFPADRPAIEIKFRRGVFQFMAINICKENSIFKMTVINENVDFGKAKNDGREQD